MILVEMASKIYQKLKKLGCFGKFRHKTIKIGGEMAVKNYLKLATPLRIWDKYDAVNLTHNRLGVANF